jgi:hypothetical protein
MLIAGGAAAGLAQAAPDAAKPTPPTMPEKKPAPEAKEKIAHGYLVHQSLEVGGRITSTTGSLPMWDTLVNLGTGGRILSQSLELHSVDRSKTPIFDTLTTNSFGYGGDANDVSYLNVSKGRIYDFAGSFRRDRQYFDYNLLANSLNSTSAGLVPEFDSPHLFNTVRRNTDTLLTLMPLSPVSVRFGYNRGIHEGPSYSSVHEGADGFLFQNWNNSTNTYTGGVDWKILKRTTLSYDQFFVQYEGNTSWELAGLNEKLSDGTPVSFGLDPGSGPCPGVVNGVGLATCNGYLAMSITQPIRTSFPTEQLRFNTHYWDRVSMNARIAYSGGKSTVNHFNELFNGLTTRTGTREEIDTGAGPNGQLSTAKRDNVNADYGLVAELSKYLSISDAFNYWDFRVPGSNNVLSTVYSGNSMLTPPVPPTTAPMPVATENFLNQKIGQNTVMATVSVTAQVNLSGGYRYKVRDIDDSGPDSLSWHENWLLLGAVFQPTPIFRVNLNYDHMDSKAANSATLSNTFTRAMPNKAYDFRARAQLKPAKWVNFAGTVSEFAGKNDDPLVNHTEHNRDVSFVASIIPMETLSLDFNVAHDDVLSQTDICYVSSAPLAGAASTGTCDVSISGSASYVLGSAYYHAPATYFSGSINFQPSRILHFNGGARVNAVDGEAEMLNPNMVPGALQSKFITPFTDMEIRIAPQWVWHGNWTHYGYSEQGPVGLLPSRNVYGEVVTLGVKYAF